MDITDAMVEAGLRAAEEACMDHTFGKFREDSTFETAFTDEFKERFRLMHRCALTAAIGAGGQAVAVKPLEWRAGDEDGWWSALPMTGLPYEVRRTGRGNVRVRVPDNGGWCPFDGTVTEAKAAAQANYEQRILSALSQPHPADERVVEALRKIEYCLTKDSLCEAEKIDDALKAVRRLIAAKEGR